jgi:hypothetical protein
MKMSAARGGQALVAVVFAALAVRLFRLTAQYAVNIFFWDQWDFNDATLFEHHSIWAIFRFQHGPHRQGLGGVLAAVVDPWFRWNSRSEAFVATGLVVAAGLCMVYLKCRLFGPLSWPDVAIPMIVFTPAQWEAVWNTVNFAHGTLPVLLIVLYCLAWTWRNERAKYALITLLNLATLYTGFGFFLGLLTPVLLFASYRENRARPAASRIYLLVCIAVSVASLASFFVGYRNDDASGCDTLFSATPLEYLRFLSLMFATPFAIRGIGLAATVAGAVLLAGVAAIALISWKRVLGGCSEPRARHIVLATLSAYSILFCVAATLGRTCTGLVEAHSSRYGSYKQLAVLCLFFAILALPARRWRVGLAALLVVLLIPSLFMTAHDAEDMTALYELKSGWRECYLSGRAADDCDDDNGAIYPDPERTHLQRKLDYLRATRQNLFSDGSGRP